MEKNAIPFLVFAAAMLATPLILFAIAWARDSVFLVDCSGALFGIDSVLVYAVYGEHYRPTAPKTVRG